MSMLSEQGMCATTDDELLDSKDHYSLEPGASKGPPPIPPRTKSVPSLKNIPRSDSITTTPTASAISSPPTSRHRQLHTRKTTHFVHPVIPESHLDDDSSRLPRQDASPPNPAPPTTTRMRHCSLSRRLSQQQYQSNFAGSDSDTDSSDFVSFVPPARKSRYSSEPIITSHINHLLKEVQKQRRSSSPAAPANKEDLKKSSPILTKRPGWYSKPDKARILRKYQSEISFPSFSQAGNGSYGINKHTALDKKKSGSAEAFCSLSKSPVKMYTAALPGCSQLFELSDLDYDTTGGTVESKDYSKPFEHTLWKKLGLEDGSALSGSLPDMLSIVHSRRDSKEYVGEEEETAKGEEEGEEEDTEGCTYLDPKELEDFCERYGDRRDLASRIQRRASTVLGGTYLTLLNILPTPVTDDGSSKAINAANTARSSSSQWAPGTYLTVCDKWKYRADADTSCNSGYSTDASSGWGEFEMQQDPTNPLKRVPSLRVKGGRASSHASTATHTLHQSVMHEDFAKPAASEGKVTAENEEEIYEEIDNCSDAEFKDETAPSLPKRTPQHGKFSLQQPSDSATFPRHYTLQSTHSVPVKSSSPTRHHQTTSRQKEKSQLRSESPYASLDEIIDLSKKHDEPPSLPPRPSKMDPGLAKHLLTRKNSPGVSLRMQQRAKYSSHHTFLMCRLPYHHFTQPLAR